MTDQSYDMFMTDCNHCGKYSIHRGRWIDFGRKETYTYKCGWCGKITQSKWTFAHPSIIGHFLSITRSEPIYEHNLPSSFYQYPLPPKECHVNDVKNVTNEQQMWHDIQEKEREGFCSPAHSSPKNSDSSKKSPNT